jgi:hypothetical protein
MGKHVIIEYQLLLANVGNRNGPDLGQVLQNIWWIESDFTVRKLVKTDSSAFQLVEVCP